MNRREALHRTALLGGAAALWAALPSRTWAALAAPTGWSASEEELLTLIGDTILPATPGSPGAGSVGIGRFVCWMTTECFPVEAAAAVRRGLEEIQAEGQRRFLRPFSDLPPGEREQVLTAYEARSTAGKGGAIAPFRHIKELVLLGYFTSEPGATQALRYDPVPGAYRGSVRLAKDERSWAS